VSGSDTGTLAGDTRARTFFLVAEKHISGAFQYGVPEAEASKMRERIEFRHAVRAEFTYFGSNRGNALKGHSSFGKPEVTKLDYAADDQNVVSFEITMKNIRLVEVLNTGIALIRFRCSSCSRVERTASPKDMFQTM